MSVAGQRLAVAETRRETRHAAKRRGRNLTSFSEKLSEESPCCGETASREMSMR